MLYPCKSVLLHREKHNVLEHLIYKCAPHTGNRRACNFIQQITQCRCRAYFHVEPHVVVGVRKGHMRPLARHTCVKPFEALLRHIRIPWLYDVSLRLFQTMLSLSENATYCLDPVIQTYSTELCHPWITFKIF